MYVGGSSYYKKLINGLNDATRMCAYVAGFLASYLKDYPEMKLACVRMLQGSGESPKRMKI